jgi:hypothetical protein
MTHETTQREAVEARVAWLHGRAGGYTPGPWEQLRKVYRASGMSGEAAAVGVAQQRYRRAAIADHLWRQRGTRRVAAAATRGWSRLLEATVGYGFRPWLVLRWLALVYLIGLAVFFVAWNAGGLQPTTQPPRVFALGWYALDVLVPFLDLGQQDAWLPTPAAFPAPAWGWIVVGWYWTTILAGWVLSTIAVAGLTGALRRD